MDRNDLLSTTRTEFLRLFSQAMGDLIARSMDQLFNKANNFLSSTDQDLFLDARSVLAHRHDELQQQMVGGMEQLIKRSFQTAYNNFRPSFSSAYTSNRFALVDSFAVEDELRIGAMTKRFRDEAEGQLRDLNIRVALLLNQDNIKERENPFRPYLFARCIISATESLGIAPALAAVLSDQLALDLSNNIAGIYDGINAYLAQHGIAVQLQLKIRKSPNQSTVAGNRQPDGTGPRPQHLNQTAAAAPVRRSRADQFFEMIQGIADSTTDDASPANQQRQAQAASPTMRPGAGTIRASWLSGSQTAAETLRAFFSGLSISAAQAGKFDSFNTPYPPSRLTQSVHRLLRECTPNGDAMLDANGAVRNLVAEQRASLNKKTHDRGEQMTIDIVAMLFEFILRDSQIPAAIRVQLGRLQFLVLKMALPEPGLLARKSHPARMMLDRIGSISIGLEQADPIGARITAEISRIVAALLADEIGNPQLVSSMLDQFDAFIARELRISDVQVERAAQAVEQAENRALRFARTVAEIDAALSGLSIAPLLHNFFVTSWAHAIECAGRTDGRREKRFRQLIADLLWSIVPKVTEQDRAQLVALLPIMLLELRDGLKLAGLEQKQQQDILNWLVDAHTQAMRSGSGALASQVPSLSDTHQHFEPFIEQIAEDLAPQPAAASDCSMGHFIREAALELGIALQVIDPTLDLNTGSASALAAAIPANQAPAAQDAILAARLRSGVMVEINLDGAWVPARLRWASPNALHLLFSVGQHHTLSVVGRPMFGRLLAHGRARFPEVAPLFERAVHSLLQAAAQVDGN